MGITKLEGFTETITKMADLFKVMGHPARMSIIEYLAKSDTCIVNDLSSILPLAQPTISRHLSELKRVGLIQGSIEGNNRCYCLNVETWKQVMNYMNYLNRELLDQDNCC